MDIEIRNLRVFNDISFVAHSARVSGVGKIRCECGGDKNCERCGGSGLREPTDSEIFNMVLENDYSSALEHIVFTFEIHGLSKGNSAELLEHRIASHTGRSTRYQSEVSFDYVLPPAVSQILKKYSISPDEYKAMVENGEVNISDASEEDIEVLRLYSQAVKAGKNAYKSLLEIGVPKESARYALPFSVHTAYTYTINLRSLINFLGLRLCVRASPEMRCLASKIYLAVREAFPEIDRVWCRGYNHASCPENEVRDSPQGRECPFKNPESDVFIPTKKHIRAGVKLKPFSHEKFSEVRESLLKKWSEI